MATSVAALATVGATSAVACPNSAPEYYLALGDSLSVGMQPAADGHLVATGHGYTDRLYAAQRRLNPRLKLVKLGCSGESTATMITGGSCRYHAAASQLDAAVDFLAKHRGKVRLVTLDIGANDILPCAKTTTGLDRSCAADGLRNVAVNLPAITARLRVASPAANVRFAAMDYYDPFLAASLLGPKGQLTAAESLAGVNTANAVLHEIYARTGFLVAPVSSSFNTDDTTPVSVPGIGQVPRNVATVCGLTWACTPPPAGPDIHPNDAGYQTIATAFATTLADAPHN
ncbi:SGNH/GDSL hydrolase family protein [Kitasatospora sp. NPDC059571]|uniref:SGNH/GDSL hydrolase family protein n=1 Tax=Kitasatospora sp. NPDC059571 TaxID=3346871 RepID=UPI00368DE2E8